MNPLKKIMLISIYQVEVGPGLSKGMYPYFVFFRESESDPMNLNSGSTALSAKFVLLPEFVLSLTFQPKENKEQVM